jgi:hypothetical protein
VASQPQPMRALSDPSNALVGLGRWCRGKLWTGRDPPHEVGEFAARVHSLISAELSLAIPSGCPRPRSWNSTRSRCQTDCGGCADACCRTGIVPSSTESTSEHDLDLSNARQHNGPSSVDDANPSAAGKCRGSSPGSSPGNPFDTSECLKNKEFADGLPEKILP